MPVTLYHVPRTISSPIVQILLELEVVDNPVIVHEMPFPDLKSKEHLAINPMGTSPAFQDTDLGITMWESGAVLDYLLECYDVQNRFHPAPTDEHSSPEQIRARAKYLQLKQFIIATVYPFIASLYVHSLKDKDQQDKKYMAAAKQKCRTVIEPVLLEWLGDGPFLLGDRISVVDFLAAKPLMNAKALSLLSGFPALEALLERVSNRPTYKEAYESIGDKSVSRPVDQSIVLVPSKQKSITPKMRFTWGLRQPATTSRLEP
jgi:glutathione S-transferase